MSHDQVQRLLDRLLGDPDLRAEFARDPEATAERLGVGLGDDEVPPDRPQLPDDADGLTAADG